MRFLPFSFFVLLYFIVSNIKCAEKSTVLHKAYTFRNGSSVIETFVSLNLSAKKWPASEKRCSENGTVDPETGTTGPSRTAKKLVDFAFSSWPPFDLSDVAGVTRTCRTDSRKYIRDLRLFKLWALKMYDSSAKIPSGLLNGNVNQLGDFDMCLSALSEDREIRGQYCLASIEIQTPYNPYLASLHKLVQSHYHFKSKLEDPGHRVPRFSSINWALCVPNSCTPKDVEIGLKRSVSNFFNGTELELRYEVDPAMCQTTTKSWNVPYSTLVAISIFVTILLFETFATIYDAYTIEDRNRRWITSFSLKKNVKTLVTINESSDGIRAVHGIRMLNAILLLLAHKSMAVLFLPYHNRTDAVEYLARPFTVLCRAASLYTDPFIMMSGLLTSYALIGKLRKAGTIDILQEYVSRLYRIVPTFAALIAFCTFILPWISSGPMWNLVVTHHSHICKQYWWRNMLFIHNYFGFKDMCLTHTHHLGIDTQLFFTSPFMVYVIWKWPKKGSAVLLLLATASTIARYYITYTMKLSNYVHFGTSVQQLFDTADNMYILPPHRATVYIMGIFLGYFLRTYSHFALNKTQIRIGNTLALFSFLISYLGPAFMGNIDYVYNPTDAALYAAFSPILWVASFCWIIYTSHLGHLGFVGKFFCHPVWTIWTRLSYTVYLTQFPIFFFNVGTTRSTRQFGLFSMLLNLQEFVWILVLSAILTVVIEMPFQNLRNLMVKRTKSDDYRGNCDAKKHS